MVKKYRVRLSGEERTQLETLVNKGKETAHKRRHAQILLKADEGELGPGWKDGKIAEALDVSLSAIERLRECFVTKGLEAALTRAIPDRSHRRKIDGEKEAHLIALACSDPPAGRSDWTLKLLADRMVELEHVDSLSYETVRQALKKTNLSRG
jgi:transposase